MNILDENIGDDQRKYLRAWRVPVHRIGYDIGQAGMKDEAIIPWLLQLPRSTFFSRDLDFYRRGLVHRHYCLVYLAIEQNVVAEYVRRVLRHPEFNTATKRMGTVIRAAPTGLTLWRLHTDQEIGLAWPD
jgi:hypothetical protein